MTVVVVHAANVQRDMNVWKVNASAFHNAKAKNVVMTVAAEAVASVSKD